MKKRISNYIEDAVNNYNALLFNEGIQNTIGLIIDKSIQAFQNGNKILLCGNGGSAADAQHIASELSGKFCIDRPPLYAEALHVNSSYITSVSNDYGYATTYSRMVEAAGRKHDILIGLSTSGKSQNVLNALIKAKEKGMLTVGLTGKDIGEMNTVCDIIINVPSTETARVQEGHILIGHIICQLIEEKIFGG